MGNTCSAEVKVYKAAKRNDVDALKSLVQQYEHLRQDYNVNIGKFLEWEDPNGRTPLQIAAARGHYQCVELLLQHGADIAHINKKLEGGTALHEAVANQKEAVAGLLVQRGCLPSLENIKGLTAFDLAIKNGHASMLRLLEQHAWFRGHLLVKVPSLGGMKKQWARRWVVIVPRYPCPLLPSERRRGYHTMMLLYKRDDHATPCARIFLNGASATPTLPKDARGAQRPSAMYPLQCVLTLHLSHTPTPVGFKANGRAGFVVHLRPETSNLQHCSRLRQVMDIVNTASAPAPGTNPLGPLVPTIPNLLPASPSQLEALPPLQIPSPGTTAGLSPASSFHSSTSLPHHSRHPTYSSSMSMDANPHTSPAPRATSPQTGSARISSAPGYATLQDEEVARQLQRQFDAEAAEFRANAVPGPLGRAQSTTATTGSGVHGDAAGAVPRRASMSGPSPMAAGGSQDMHGRGRGTAGGASGSSPTRPSHGKSPSAPPLSAVMGDGIMGIPDSHLCVICLEAPQEAGFLHGNTVHRCCCKKCALDLKKKNTERCPMCREPIDHVVLAVY